LIYFDFKLVSESVNDIINTQRELEEKFDSLISDRTKDSLGTVTKNLKAATYGLQRSYKQNPLTGDNLEKIESDRYDMNKNLTGFNSFILE
jgi:hypothetical protein